ncbi:helix-turn-helix domain-containing protein [Winogradskyella immobilis]|uniref:Helix-turn-helix transcriptional regulator n=1 Tax=Winogradskyella immobilis TaxID=2816852 RepID=A0ABS8EQ21_9FLAO|nr:helix-turn-helix transcriptional regulator [Winogradskyella immobilis]MCC1485087.1 helix-turn-helix transcriptional regulator [Winogradskyella immobilis]MCG0017179.1 helix-turn-helix transcriptional regulator [Winogradskyella immobilis]
MFKNIYLYTVFVFCFSFYSSAQLDKNKGSIIQGEIELDTTIWESKAYLSYIPTFDYMSAISYDMIVSATEIDSSGHFSFNISFLPESNQLYRIHIPKKNTSPISLIIGGKDENHMFLIASKTSSITINNKVSTSLFNYISFVDDATNTDLQHVIRITKSEDDIDFNATLMQRQLIKDTMIAELKSIAEQNQNPLVSLYALYESNLDINNKNDNQFIGEFYKKWNSEDSPYFNTFRNTYPIKQTNNYYFILIGLGLVLLIAGYAYQLFHRKKKGSIHKKQLQSLSIQERKILGLIQQGLSNKQISEECHIELSTVKSHVNNIYSKLNIKSRKEAITISV